MTGGRICLLAFWKKGLLIPMAEETQVALAFPPLLHSFRPSMPFSYFVSVPPEPGDGLTVKKASDTSSL